MYFMKVLIQVKNPDFGFWILHLDSTPYFGKATIYDCWFFWALLARQKTQFYDIGFQNP